MRSALAGLLSATVTLVAAASSATTINLSSVSSDATPASQLDASLDFSVSGSTLTLTVTNTGSDFNINEIFFNGSDNVTGISLTSATHNVAGDVTAAWVPVETAVGADGFGTFDFALTDGVGETNDNIMEPGESIVFVLSITGGGTYTDADFIVANSMGYAAAGKFVNGPDDPEAPGNEDSAYGAVVAVPEPATSLLMAVGVAGLLIAGRKRN